MEVDIKTSQKPAYCLTLTHLANFYICMLVGLHIFLDHAVSCPRFKSQNEFYQIKRRTRDMLMRRSRGKHEYPSFIKYFVVFDLGDAVVKFSHVQKKKKEGGKNPEKNNLVLENICHLLDISTSVENLQIYFRVKLWMSRRGLGNWKKKKKTKTLYFGRPCADPLHPWLKQMRQIIGSAVNSPEVKLCLEAF